MALEFKLSGAITPKLVAETLHPTASIGYKIDVQLRDAFTKHKGDRSYDAIFTQAVKENIENMDNVLLAHLENTARAKRIDVRSGMVHLNVETGNMLQQATDFLAANGFKGIKRGKILMACALLYANEQKLIPAWDPAKQY